MTNTDVENDDEVSLKEFKSQLNRLRSFLRQIALGSITLFKRYFALVLLLAVGFAALAFYQYKYLRSYTAKASFVYIESQKKIYGEMVDKLEEMVKTGSYQQVAKALNLSEMQAHTIVGIKATNSRQAKASEDITENERLFYIEITATRQTIFDTLQPAIEYYLNNNPFIKRKMISNKERIESSIAFMEQELINLDSLKTAYTNSLSRANNPIAVGSNPFNPSEVYAKSEKIHTDIDNLKALLKNNYKAVQVQDGFMVSQVPNDSLFAIAAKYFVFFLVSSFVLIFVLSIFRK